jgi:16S rRNA processing protein RimM
MVETTMSEKQILLGRILGAHGLKGEVKIKSFTENPLDVASYGAVSAPDGRRFTLTRARMQGDIVIAGIKGVDDRNVAEQLKGLELSVTRADLPETEDGEFYQADLVGLAVFDIAGNRIGEVVGFQYAGTGDLIEIERTNGSIGLVPFADSMVPEVDVANGRAVLSEGGLAVLGADDIAARKAGTR